MWILRYRWNYWLEINQGRIKTLLFFLAIWHWHHKRKGKNAFPWCWRACMACSILGARFVCSRRWKMSCQSKTMRSNGRTALAGDCWDSVVQNLTWDLKHVPPSGLHASLYDVKDILLGVRTINLEVLTVMAMLLLRASQGCLAQQLALTATMTSGPCSVQISKSRAGCWTGETRTVQCWWQEYLVKVQILGPPKCRRSSQSCELGRRDRAHLTCTTHSSLCAEVYWDVLSEWWNYLTAFRVMWGVMGTQKYSRTCLRRAYHSYQVVTRDVRTILTML